MRRPRRELHRALGLLGALVITALIVRCGGGNDSSGTTTSTAEVSPPAADAALEARGREIFVKNCASCHGVNAEGAPNWQQPDAQGNMPPPPHDDSGHTWRHSDAELTGIIKNGLRDRFNKSPELTMPPFAIKLTDEEIAAVIAYFKSLWSTEHRQYQEEQNQKMVMATPEGTP